MSGGSIDYCCEATRISFIGLIGNMDSLILQMLLHRSWPTTILGFLLHWPRSFVDGTMRKDYVCESVNRELGLKSPGKGL